MISFLFQNEAISMANSKSMNTSYQIKVTEASDRPEDRLDISKTYPASVTEVSKMLAHAHKDSLPLPRSLPRVSVPSRISAGSRLFKKSHTCGSLYAKCDCKDDSAASFETFDVVYFSRNKRASNPSLEDFLNPDTKRFSSPEINVHKVPQVCHTPRLQKSTQKSIYKPNIYHDYPEINYPIPIDLIKNNCDKLVPNQSKSLPNNFCPDLKSKLDYHKYTALSYESQHLSPKEEEAQKFLQDFGIISPMGNGASLKKNSKNSVDDAIQQIRKTSKARELTKKNSVSLDEFEHLKVVNERLTKDLADLELKHEDIERKLDEANRELNTKRNVILKLQREVHKLKVSINQKIQEFSLN